ncbi:fused uroporphyrinogen-III synthase HemD/membrane protein HemX [Caballeronia sp. LZ043]|uniref:fused uroporphyrinogen-III synthase HemD/membrane protein HemX n=1 Tax=Caballeronia sp. LZ043 TaxID=3038569 RepID=UPI002855BF17|nr:fused uroporphyrinogen-III synthase HemD/membrane protein HemX [Caballeronia sp. LZ043]MDR5819521.1 fused uroporphyrinogen-III synthase HemD/membrane protein HemX [Caballeronia sp. LZ043]
MPGPRRATVIVTRPAGQSSTLLARLASAGFDTLEFPLIDIAPVADDAPLRAALDQLYLPPDAPERYALVVFVSPNAIDHAFSRLAAPWPADLPVAVVGPGSVTALARQGVHAPAQRVITPSAEKADPRFDSEALYAAIEAEFGATGLEGRRVLIVRGDGGREWLAERLVAAGARVEKAAAYRRVLPEPSMQKWERVHALLTGEPPMQDVPHAWLLTSSEGVRNLNELAYEHLTADEIARLKRAPLVCPHPRIAEAARGAGFDRMTVSGAGDDRIVHALETLFPSGMSGAEASAQTHQSHQTAQTHRRPEADAAAGPASESAPAQQSAPQPAHQPAPSRMTDPNDSKKDSPQPNVTPPLPPNTPFTPFEQQKRRSGAGLVLLWVVVVILAVAAGAGAFVLNRKFDRAGTQLSQRLAQADQQNAELRAKADQAASATTALNTQLIQLQGKLADAEAHSQALQQQYQDLASNRDDWTVAEVEQILSSASQQLQLTGNVQLALFALQSADTRLAATNGPQVVAIRKAIAQDMDKLKSAPTTDLTGLAIKLDTAIGQIDQLPLAGEAPLARARAQAAAPADSASIAAATGEPRWKVLWRQITSGIGQQLSSLVSVRRIDNADAMLTSPDQGYFVRENVKLRLLSARLSLLSRSEPTLKSDLSAADAALARYFDPSSKKVEAVRELVKQVDQASLAVSVPNLNDSLAAVHQFKRGG